MSDTRDSSLGGSSLVHTAQPSSFDLRQESDVIALLKLVHQNSIDPDIKNHLRDLIFAFRQSMQEEDLEKVRQGFLPLGVAIKSGLETKAPEPLETTATKKQTWGARPAPKFVGVSTQKVEPIQTSSPVSQPVVPKDENIVVMPSAWPAQAQTASVEAVKKEEPKEEQSTTAPTPPPIIPPAAEPVVYQDYGERIKEIKRIVNEKVGNPVNLIDSHNEIGREYMNALLDAMKKTSGGAVGGAAEAMVRLENAFERVRQVVILGNAAPAPTEEKVTASEPIRAQAEPAVAKAPQPQVVEQVEEPAALIVHEEIPQTVQKVEPEPEKIEVAAPIVEATMPVRRTSVRERLQEDAPPQVPQMQQAVAAVEGGLHSVAKDKQLQDLLRANRQQEELTFKQQEDARIAAMDPLQAPDVTSGLSQLLSEWSLFKSSGIFGTGPSGKDHPLYQKIAPLTMAAVIAGRFEGATTSIKQSITDYMNGWRYEEGITHEHGETFEHYLRRVVRHILTKQKRP